MKNEFRADLHVHSTYSDGTCTPEELILAAKEIGLQGLSITDHDSIAVYQEASALAKKHDLMLVTGVEFSALYLDESVHVLGYGFSLRNQELLAFCERHKERRVERNEKILKRLASYGIFLDPELFQGDGNKTWGRPHIAQALVDQGMVSSIQEAFDYYLGEGKKAYEPGASFTVLETIAMIRQAGGFAILAHPHLIRKRRVTKRLLELDFDGLEGYYARLSAGQERSWIELGTKKGWIVTGGSDYHGSVKPYSQLGSSWVNEATFRILYERTAATNED